MSERYKKLYHLKRRLYASGAPVIIESGALLLEQPSNARLCQLCFRNIQDRPIKSLRAVVQMLDERGQPLGKPVDHRYLDLDLKREEEYGRETAIVLPSEPAASFTVQLRQVSFADGEVWSDHGLAWEELPEPLSLEEFCGGRAKAEHYRKRFGAACCYAPLEAGELWFCACGAANPIAEAKCHRCRCRQSALLGRSADARPAEELEESRFHAWERLPKAGSKRKRGLLFGAAGLLLLGGLALFLLPRLQSAPPSAEVEETAPVDEQAEAYQAALSLLDAGDLDAAEDAFRALGAYEDSADMVALAIPYRRALLLQEMADYAPLEDAPALYEQAAEAFAALGDYQDCEERVLHCRSRLEEQQLTLVRSDYEDAAALLEGRRYAEARAAFLALGDFEDSAELADEAVYRKAAALYDFLSAHSVKGVTATLSMEPGEESVVALPRDQLLALGSRGMSELEDAFGQDPVRFVTTDSADSLEPLEEAVAQQLQTLGDYRNSAELAALLPEMIDRSDEFFALCAAGELEEARDWLNAYNKPFADREYWLEQIALFLPYCRSWDLRAGDPSLISQAVGESGKIYSLRCQVLLREDGAVLRFLLEDGTEYTTAFRADPDENRFLLSEGRTGYLAQINNSGSLSINKLQDGAIVGGTEYVPAA